MNRNALKTAFPYTLPVMTGYLFLGIAFGIMLEGKGLHAGWALLMSLFIYAGSMQFAAIELLAGPFAPLSALLITLMVNARHLFYGLSMLEPFRKMGKWKPYMVFSLTDETYSLLCGIKVPEGVDPKHFCICVSVLDHLYWIAGSVIGALAGAFIPFSTNGIDFAMTALFLVIFLEQWESTANHLPALIGLFITFLSLIFFGSDNFLLFSMAGILAALILFRKQVAKA